MKVIARSRVGWNAASSDQRDREQQQRRGDHGERVPLLDLLDEQLRPGLGRRCLLDHGDDPGDHGVGGGPAHPYPQRTGAVEGPGEHLVAGVLRDRQRLAGDRGLIHVAGAGQHLPVRADALTRPHQDHLADLQARRVRQLLAARVVEPGGLLGGQVEQAAHGLGGAVGGHRLQRAGGGEDDDQQAAVQDLPDRRRADRREDHQQVHVQGLRAQRPQARQPRLPPAGRVAGQEEHPRHSTRGVREAGGQPRREQRGCQRRPPHLGQRPQPGPPGGGHGGRGRRRGAVVVSSRLTGTAVSSRRDDMTRPRYQTT